MKDKFNLIIMGFIGLIFFTGCNNSRNSENSGSIGNSTVNRNTAVNSSNLAIVTNSANESNPAIVTNSTKASKTATGSEPESKINIDNFNKLEQGTKYKAVAELFGSKGKLVSENKENHIVMYEWSDTPRSYAKIVFQDKNLTAKDSKGLR